MARRGADAWKDVEAAIERRNPRGYDTAIELLVDLKEISRNQGTQTEFARHVEAIRERHERKERFIQRLAGLGLFHKAEICHV